MEREKKEFVYYLAMETSAEIFLIIGSILFGFYFLNGSKQDSLLNLFLGAFLIFLSVVMRFRIKLICKKLPI